jgi:uncharacterized protein YbcI
MDAASRTSLRNAISSAMARIKHEFYGKGPASTRTFICDRIVFAVLEDVLTPVEAELKKAGRAALVRRVRLTFEDLMTRTFTGEIERLTGARVLAYHSQIVFDPDLAIEIFVLDRAPGGDATPATGVDAEPRRPGPVRAAIADAMIRILHDHWGKGPTRAKAYVEDRFVLCVLDEPLTTFERTLVDGGETDLVRALRLEFQAVVGDECAERVRALTGRQVIVCDSQIVFDPDILFQFFVLGEPA